MSTYKYISSFLCQYVHMVTLILNISEGKKICLNIFTKNINSYYIWLKEKKLFKYSFDFGNANFFFF